MANFPIAAPVECTDGPCGKSTNVIVNPVTRQVTHVVVEDKSLPDYATRVVPVAFVANATPQRIELSCARADVAKMGPFIVSDFIPESPYGGAYATGEAWTAQYVVDDTAYDEVREEDVPAGEFALYSGMHVEARDGRVGRLDELVLDRGRGVITNLLMRKGHLWGTREIAVPIGQVDFVDGSTVYLKIDRASVGALPAAKIQRK
ncbi:MAG TPA: hypothetical protein VGS60_09555 [Actinomycetes bacterium]|jgi:hypothetical protein|nr:hypothetical protein [Actinomycetes bacterium]